MFARFITLLAGTSAAIIFFSWVYNTVAHKIDFITAVVNSTGH